MFGGSEGIFLLQYQLAGVRTWGIFIERYGLHARFERFEFQSLGPEYLLSDSGSLSLASVTSFAHGRHGGGGSSASSNGGSSGGSSGGSDGGSTVGSDPVLLSRGHGGGHAN